MEIPKPGGKGMPVGHPDGAGPADPTGDAPGADAHLRSGLFDLPALFWQAPRPIIPRTRLLSGLTMRLPERAESYCDRPLAMVSRSLVRASHLAVICERHLQVVSIYEPFLTPRIQELSCVRGGLGLFISAQRRDHKARRIDRGSNLDDNSERPRCSPRSRSGRCRVHRRERRRAGGEAPQAGSSQDERVGKRSNGPAPRERPDEQPTCRRRRS